MGGTTKLDLSRIEYCERRIKDLRSQKRKLETMVTKIFTEQADPKGRKKSRKEIESLKRMLNCPETPKELAQQADLLDVKKHLEEIYTLDVTIKFMEKKKKCITIAGKRSISMEAAQQLVEQEDKLKDEKKRQKVLGKKLVAQPTGEDSAEASPPPPPPVHRYRPCPVGCDAEEYNEWLEEYHRVEELNAAVNNLPTQTYAHKDPATVAAVSDPDEKTKLLNVAKAIVSVSSRLEIQDPEDLDMHCTGVIIRWDTDNKRAKILTCSCFGHDVDDDYKCKIFVRWPCKEDGGLIEAKLLFFCTFYQISLLEVAFQGTLLDVPTKIPPIGLSPPKHGDEVFALGRDKDLSLVVRRGTIVKEQHLGELRQGYLFADYIDGAPECCTGGPVVDHLGNMVGLSFSGEGETSIILPLSTALACVHMWTEFGRIARPLLGMCFRNSEVLDDRSGDITFEGFVVDEVDPDSAAWKHGIRSGNVIVTLDEQTPKPLPEFEEFLLSYGLRHLHETYTEVDFKLEVQDGPNIKRSITLHVPFSDVANVRFS